MISNYLKSKNPLFHLECNGMSRNKTCPSTLSWQFNLEGSLCAGALHRFLLEDSVHHVITYCRVNDAQMSAENQGFPAQAAAHNTQWQFSLVTIWDQPQKPGEKWIFFWPVHILRATFSFLEQKVISKQWNSLCSSSSSKGFKAKYSSINLSPVSAQQVSHPPSSWECANLKNVGF